MNYEEAYTQVRSIALALVTLHDVRCGTDQLSGRTFAELQNPPCTCGKERVESSIAAIDAAITQPSQRFHENAFSLVWPAIGGDQDPKEAASRYANAPVGEMAKTRTPH